MTSNDDEIEIETAPGSETVENPDGRVVDIGGYQVLSSCWANPTPWDSPREADEDRLFKIFEEIAADLDSRLPVIFNLHAPPYDSGLDTAFDIDGDLKVVTVGGQPRTIPAGSHAVRKLIERYEPFLASTVTCTNRKMRCAWVRRCASIRDPTTPTAFLTGVILDLEAGEVVRHQLTRDDPPIGGSTRGGPPHSRSSGRMGSRVAGCWRCGHCPAVSECQTAAFGACLCRC
jgi:hypothetical protein